MLNSNPRIPPAVLAFPGQSDREKARLKLAQMHISYTVKEFLERTKSGHVAAVELFLRSGMDPNATDEYGQTPLLSALISGNIEVVKLVIAGGANVNARFRFQPQDATLGSAYAENDLCLATEIDKYDGQTPLKIAETMGRKDFVQLLKKAGATAR